MGNQRITGSVLAIMLILCLMVSMMVTVLLSSSILQIKMLNNYQDNMEKQFLAEKKLIEQEAMLENQWGENLPKEIQLIQFVPDTLLYGETQGVNYYQVTTDRLQSTFALRRKPRLPMREHKEWIASGFVLKNGKVISYNHLENFFLTHYPQVSAIALVDRDNSESVDMLYFVEMNKLFKIDMTTDKTEWQAVMLADNLEKVIGQPLVGRHPNGKGVLIYILAEISANHHLIYVLADTDMGKASPWYVIDEKTLLGQPCLWQGLLLTPQQDTLSVYDAFTGELLQSSKMQNLISHSGQPLLLQPPIITVNYPREKRRQIQWQVSKGIGLTFMALDYAQVGRKTWTELSN